MQKTLLQAVLKIIVEGGIDAVRYRAVADVAKVSLGTVSYHYKTREDLLRAALTYYLEENVAQLLRLKNDFMNARPDDIAQYLVDICRRDFSDKQKLVLAEYELMVFAARDNKIAMALEQYESLLINHLTQILQLSKIKNAAAVARTLSEMVRGFQLQGLGHKKHNYDDFARRLKQVISNA
jgi:AcrR family transcriptional regulator